MYSVLQRASGLGEWKSPVLRLVQMLDEIATKGLLHASNGDVVYFSTVDNPKNTAGILTKTASDDHGIQIISHSLNPFDILLTVIASREGRAVNEPAFDAIRPALYLHAAMRASQAVVSVYDTDVDDKIPYPWSWFVTKDDLAKGHTADLADKEGMLSKLLVDYPKIVDSVAKVDAFHRKDNTIPAIFGIGLFAVAAGSIIAYTKHRVGQK